MKGRSGLRILGAGLILLGLFVALAHAQRTQKPLVSEDRALALILVRSSNSGPPIPSSIDSHLPIIKWSAAFTRNHSNRILSLVTGLDWKGEEFDFTFRVIPGSQRPEGQAFESANFESLERRGFFQAKQAWLCSPWMDGKTLVPVANPTGLPTTSPLALLAALDSANRVTPESYSAPKTAGHIYVFEASTPEEESYIAGLVQGRTLVMEFPDSKAISSPYTPPDELVTRAYFRGLGWPEGWPTDPITHVNGLIDARLALRLLAHPEDFSWSHDYPSADPLRQWFSHPYGLMPTLLFIFGGVVIYVFASAAYCIAVDHRGDLACIVMRAIALGPAAVLLSGNLDRIWGMTSWFGWFSGVLAALYVGSLLLELSCRKWLPETHPLLPFAFLGLIACFFGDPNWSVFSRPFRDGNAQVCAETIGLYVSYLTAVVAFCQPDRARRGELPKGKVTGAQWLARGVAGFCLVVVVLGLHWWSGDDWSLRTLPLLAWLAGESLLTWPLLVLWGLLPHGPSPYSLSIDIVRYGASSSPMNCLPDYASLRALNLSEYLDFLLNPGTSFLFLAILACCVVANRYFISKLRMAVYRDPRILALLWLTAGLLCFGILDPMMLPAVSMAGFGAIIVVSYTTVKFN